MPAHTAISRELGIAIVTGAHPPGSILPGEFDIVSEKGVSRSVVREAMRMLAAKGLVESRPRSGTRVRETRNWNMLDPDVLEWMFEGEPPVKFVNDLFELRMMVEPAAAQLAACKRHEHHLPVLHGALEQMAAHTLTTHEGQLADQQFHATILEATDNDLVINLSAIIGAAVRWTTHFKCRRSEHPRDPIEEHRRLYQAIADSDAMRAHAAAADLIRLARHDTEILLRDGPHPG